MRIQNEQQKLMMLLEKANKKLSQVFESRVKITKHKSDAIKILEEKLIALMMNDNVCFDNQGKEISKYE